MNPGAPRPGERLALAAIALAALAVRAVGFQDVFPGEDVVAFAFGDPHYHLRLAQHALERFPDFLVFDRYVAFPDGAPVTYPPLYDLFVAASALVLGASTRALEHAAAWWPAVLGALTALPVHAIGRAVGGPRVGLGAALVFALLPASVLASAVGYADHHAAVVFLATSLLALQVGLLERTPATRAGALARAALLALARAALLLTWSGAFLYLGLAEASFALAALALARRRALGIGAASLAATAALAAPFVARMVAGGGPAFSAVQLSWLAVVAALALALAFGLVAARHPSPSAPRRFAEAAGVGAIVALAVLAVPGLGAGVVAGIGYLAKQDVAALATVEQQPMLRDAATLDLGVLLLGAIAWILPALPLALAWLAWRERSPVLGVVAAWNAALAGLAASQIRYANDFAPTAAVGLALVAARIGSGAASRLRAPGAAGAALAVALAGLALVPTLPRHHLPALRRALTADHAERLRSPEATIVRFARGVRAATPETSGFADPDAEPEYGLLCDPSLGHALHYEGRRPTLADNLGPWAGEAAFVRSIQLLLGAPSDASEATLRALRVRYVVTNWQRAYHEGGLLHWLHEFDGRAHGGHPALERYRLVFEGPRDGLPLAALVGDVPPPGSVPYKLFEVVEGAVLEVAAAPGSLASASAIVATPLGRRFAHRVRARAGADGRARLRVPYATRCGDPVCPVGAYRVEVDGAAREVAVELDDVREGRVLRVD